MTTVLTSDLPAGQTLDMPCNNLLTTRMQTATMTSLTGNGGKIHQTLCVDAVNFAAVGADGSLLKPFQTLQQAIDYAVLQAWLSVELLIAPATYAAAVAVPADLIVSFQGWDETGQGPAVILGGDITVVGGVGSNGVVAFCNCQIFAANISSVDPNTQDLWVTLVNTYCLAVVRGFNTTIELRNSILDGDAAPIGGMLYRWDGASWAKTLDLTPVFPAACNHLFYDAGHDTFRANVAVNAAIGVTSFVDVAFPPYIQQFDRVQVQMANPATMDLLVGVHGINQAIPNTVKCWITNLSRVAGVFDEDCIFMVHHDQMAVEPGVP